MKNLIQTAFGTIGAMTDPEEEKARTAVARALHEARSNRIWCELPPETTFTRTPSGVLEDRIGRQFTVYRGLPSASFEKVLYYRVRDDGQIAYYERFDR